MGQSVPKKAPPNLPPHLRGRIAEYLSAEDVLATAFVSRLGPRATVQQLESDTYTFRLPGATDHELETMSERLPNVTDLDLSGSVITDAGLAFLTRLPLRSINLFNCPRITDAGVVPLIRPRLVSIDLFCNPDITDVTATALSRCHQLRTLNLSACDSITSMGLMQVASGCTQLRTLGMSGLTIVSDVILTMFATYCSHLRALDLGGCSNIDDNGVAALSQRLKLRTLILRDTSVTDVGVYALSEVGGLHLRTLILKNCKVTDVGVSALVRCPRLRTLDLSGTQVTAVGVSALPRLQTMTLTLTDTPYARARSASERSTGRRRRWELLL
jgi:hypothetical protein